MAEVTSESGKRRAGPAFEFDRLLESCFSDWQQTTDRTLWAAFKPMHERFEALRADAERAARIDTEWTPQLREQLVRTYDMRYEELSEDSYDDGMSIDEKSQRALAAVIGVFRHWLRTGEVVHWRDALSWPKKTTDAARGAEGGK